MRASTEWPSEVGIETSCDVTSSRMGLAWEFGRERHRSRTDGAEKLGEHRGTCGIEQGFCFFDIRGWDRGV